MPGGVWSGFDIDPCLSFLQSIRLAVLHKIRITNKTGYIYASLQSKLVRLGLLLDQVDLSSPARRNARLLGALLGLTLDDLEDLVFDNIRSAIQELATSKAKLCILASLESEAGVEEAAQYLNLERLDDIQHANNVLDTIDAFLEELGRSDRKTAHPEPIAPSDEALLQGDADSWATLFHHLSKRLITCSTRHESHQTRLFLGTLADHANALRLLCSRSQSQRWHAIDFHVEEPNAGKLEHARPVSQRSRVAGTKKDAPACEFCDLLEKPPKYRATKFHYNSEGIWHVPPGTLLEVSRRNPQLQPLETWLLDWQDRRGYRKALQCILAQWLNCLYGTPWLPESWNLDNIWMDSSLAKDSYCNPYVECLSSEADETLPNGIPDATFMIRFGLLMLRIEFPEALEILAVENEETLDAEELDEYLQTFLEDDRICGNLEIRLRNVLKICQEWDDSSLPQRGIILEKIFAPLVEELRFRFSLDVPNAPEMTIKSQPAQVRPQLSYEAPQPTLISSSESVLLYDDHDETADTQSVKHANEFFQNFDRYRQTHIEPALIQRRVRIAVLDTGVLESSSIRGRLAGVKIERRKSQLASSMPNAIVDKKSFIPGDQSITDQCGHGTRVLDLLLRVAPGADFYIAKVSRTPEDNDPNGGIYVVEALDWAISHEVDLINMSFGFDGEPEDGKLQEKLLEVYRRGIKMFAAAANHGRNGPRAFPADANEVICVNASRGRGAWADDINPSATEYPDKWNTLGVGIEFSEGLKTTHRSGTSYATPLAVGIVANAMDIVRCLCAQNLLTAEQAKKLQTFSGIMKIMRLMSTDGFLAPWLLWSPNVTPSEIAHRLTWKGK